MHEGGISTLLHQLEKRHSCVGHRHLPVRFKLRNSTPNRRPAVTAPGVRCAREGLRARPQRIRPTPLPEPLSSAAPNTTPKATTSMTSRSERTTFSIALPACEILVEH